MSPKPAYGLGHKRAVVPTTLITCSQVHGNRVLTYAADNDAPPALNDPEGDAIITHLPGACVGVRSADCLPMLMHSDDGRVVAAIHAGWRGTVAGVGPATVAAFGERYKIGPERLSVTFGPCIRPCCYQVGDELIDAVNKHYPDWAASLIEERPKGRYFDLAALNRLQLEKLGVQQIDDTEDCTCCNTNAYHSYRRDGQRSGRMVSWICALG